MEMTKVAAVFEPIQIQMYPKAVCAEPRLRVKRLGMKMFFELNR